MCLIVTPLVETLVLFSQISSLYFRPPQQKSPVHHRIKSLTLSHYSVALLNTMKHDLAHQQPY